MILPRVLQIPDTFDPDDRRRRQILSIILLFFITGGLFSIITTFSYGDPFLDVIRDPDASLILLSSASLVVAFALLFTLNRYHRARSMAGWLFTLLLIAIISVSDTPSELVGRGLIIWTLPILAGGIVLPPLAVFAVALIVSIANSYISIIVLNLSPNPYAIAIFFVIAALTWLGMSITNGAIRTARIEAQKNAAILNGVADGVVVLNENDQVVLANPAALSLMGSGLTHLVAERKDQQELRGRILAFEWSHVTGVGRVAIVRDISRQIEVERAKDAILGVVNHEMRTPLTAIIGFAEVIAKRSEPVSEMAGRIRVNAQRLVHMVNNLLDHAQAQSGTLKIHSEVISLFSLMQAVTNLLSGLAREKNLPLRTFIDPTLPETIVNDKAKLQQILVNLIGNAIKFADRGEVSVSFQTPETKQANSWCIVVRDTGIGIPEERLPDIFEPFRRGSDYATRCHQGAGLGLSIVKNLVTLMNGRIEVESTVGKGSVFTVTLPLKKENICRMKSKVLIIEDDRDLASLFKIVLEMDGFEVSIVHDGVTGVEVLTFQPLPDAIMLDMHLPGVSGEEIYALMVERGIAHRVVICSADVQLVERYRGLGANAITKPTPIDDLLQLIKDIVAAEEYAHCAA